MAVFVDLAAVEAAVIAHLRSELDQPDIVVYGLDGGMPEGDHAWCKVMALDTEPKGRSKLTDADERTGDLVVAVCVPTPAAPNPDARRLASTAMRVVAALTLRTLTPTDHQVELREVAVSFPAEAGDTRGRIAELVVPITVTRASGETLVDAVPQAE